MSSNLENSADTRGSDPNVPAASWWKLRRSGFHARDWFWPGPMHKQPTIIIIGDGDGLMVSDGDGGW